MSFLFCSWAKNDESKEPEESEEEEEEKGLKVHPDLKDTGKQNSSSLGIKKSIKDDEEPEKVITNGNAAQKEEKKEDKPFFVMWNSQDDYESDKEEDEDNDKDADAEDIKGTESSSEEVADEKFSEQSQNGDGNKEEEKENGKKEATMFSHIMWKDPNKEDEYVSSEDDLEYNGEDPVRNVDDDDEDLFDSIAKSDAKRKVPSKTELNGNSVNDKEDEDLFDSIAKSVSKSMTTLFCDYDDFDIKQNVSDDDDTGHHDMGVEMNGNDNYHAGSVSSRSGSVRSRKSQSFDSDREPRRQSSREKRPKKSYELLSPTKFSKPKPTSKYFEPGTFIDKSLYNTHRCDVRIKKIKLGVQDWEAILPPRRKRKTDEDEMPLSKRKKLNKTETKKPPKPRGTDSIAKRSGEIDPLAVSRPPADGKYRGVCKYVCRQCPLCWNLWNNSQAFGQHVLNQTCQKTDLTTPKLHDTVSKEPDAVFLSVNTATAKLDSYVETSHVPPLKLLCRGSLVGRNSTCDVAITVKEGLEYYHSLVLPGHGSDSAALWRYLSTTGRITIVSTVREYEKLCRDPLKVAIYLEKKISRARAKQGSKHMNTVNWVKKYNYFLKLPLHDLFLSITKDGYRVLEAPEAGRIKLLCLVCTSMMCGGCLGQKKEKRKTSDPLKSAKKNPSKKKVVNKKKKSLKKDQKKGKAVAVPPLQLHKCKACKKYFKNKAGLKSHKNTCKAAGRKRGLP